REGPTNAFLRRRGVEGKAASFAVPSAWAVSRSPVELSSPFPRACRFVGTGAAGRRERPAERSPRRSQELLSFRRTLSIELTPKETYPQPRGEDPVIVPRAEHPISRKNLAREVLWVLGRLRAHGYKAYLVGGAVRDLYLGKSPKDYDVATDARPSRLKKIFRNCRIIGRGCRVARVVCPSGMIVEAATFRRNSSKIVRGESGIIRRDNEYGTPAEDACRRDLTINGLFYDIDTFAIIDFVGGV